MRDRQSESISSKFGEPNFRSWLTVANWRCRRGPAIGEWQQAPSAVFARVAQGDEPALTAAGDLGTSSSKEAVLDIKRCHCGNDLMLTSLKYTTLSTS